MGTAITKHKKWKKNPYLPNLIIPTKDKTVAISNKQLELFDSAGIGYVSEHAFLGIRKRVDTEQFVKIYKAQMRALFHLTQAGLRVFAIFIE